MSTQNRQPPGRPTGGEYAPTERAEPSVTLAQPAERPIKAVVNLQKWHGVHAIDVGTAEFDAAPILASLTREQRRAIADGDSEADILYEEARRLGLAPAHEGPFWVDVESELTEALEDGWDPEPTGPVPTPSPVPFASGADRDAHMAQLEGQIAALRREYARTGMVGIAKEIREAFPHVHSVELKEDEYEAGQMACEAAYDADHEPLDEEDREGIEELVRYYGSDYYDPLLNEEIGLEEAIAWHPGKDA